MRLTPHGHQERRLILELTPMVDVVFLLIIFFMVTSEFARDVRAEVDLPQLAGEQIETAEEAGLFINITSDGLILLSSSEAPVTIDQLESRIAAYVDGELTPRVTFRADRQAPIETFNEVIRILDSSGVSSARIATEVPR